MTPRVGCGLCFCLDFVVLLPSRCFFSLGSSSLLVSSLFFSLNPLVLLFSRLHVSFFTLRLFSPLFHASSLSTTSWVFFYLDFCLFSLSLVFFCPLLSRSPFSPLGSSPLSSFSPLLNSSPLLSSPDFFVPPFVSILT